MRPPIGATRAQFVQQLAELRAASGASFTLLGRTLDRPRSTIHGWCSGQHLPFPRDDHVFARLLLELGVDDPEPWLAALRRIRRRGTGDHPNPYRGLEPFTEADAERLHGRDDLVERLLALVAVPAEVPGVVIGASGAGKTSVLRAGLLARLPPTTTGQYLTPGRQPADRLGAVVDHLDHLDHLVARERHHRHVIVVDQFEELFNVSGAGAIGPTVGALGELQRRPDCEVVIGVRADFFHRLLETPLLAEAVAARQVTVAAMTRDEVTAAIVEPAAHAGLTVAPDLLAELVGQVVDGSPNGSHLPLLSHVLYLLAEHAAGSSLSLDAYRAIGGLRHSLERSAEEAFGSLVGTARERCREVFANLVELGHDGTPTRRDAAFVELEELGPWTAQVIETFVRHRLASVDRDTVCLSHEALITAWPRLAGWVDDERDALRVVRRVRLAHDAWRETGGDPSALLRGTALDEALELLRRPLGAPFAPMVQTFVERSESEREVQRQRAADVISRQVAMQAAVLEHHDPSLAGHLAVVAHSVAATTEARSAVIRATGSLAGPRFVGAHGTVALATTTGTALTVHHADGLVSRFDSVDDDRLVTRTCTWGGRASGDGTIGAVAAALSRSGDRAAIAFRDGRVVVVATDGSNEAIALEVADDSTRRSARPGSAASVNAVSFDASGESVVGGTGDGTLSVWRWGGDRWRADGVARCGAAVIDLALHPTDGSVAVALGDGRVERRAANTGPVVWQERSTSATAASAVCFAPDGSFLAAGFHDGRVRVWAIGATDHTEVRLGSAPFATWVNAVTFAPDGALFVAASSDGTVRVWDTTTWREVRPELRHPAVVARAGFVGDRLLLTTSEDGIVRTWDLERLGAGADESIWSLRFDPAGTGLMAGSRTMVTVDDAATGERRWQLTAPIAGEHFSGEATFLGDRLLIGTRRGSVFVTEPAADRPPEPFDEPRVLGGLVETFAVRPDGRLALAVSSVGSLRCWWLDAAGTITATVGVGVSDGPALGAAVDERSVAAVTTEIGDVVLLDLATPGQATELVRFPHGDGFPISVACHPGAPVLAVGGVDRTVSLWDVTDPGRPRPLARLDGPAGQVMAVGFDDRGDRLVAGSTDGSVWVWELRGDDRSPLATEPDPVAVIATGEPGVYTVAIAPDGRHVLSAGPQRRVRWWPLDDRHAAETVGRRRGDPLTDGERSRYVPDLGGLVDLAGRHGRPGRTEIGDAAGSATRDLGHVAMWEG